MPDWLWVPALIGLAAFTNWLSYKRGYRDGTMDEYARLQAERSERMARRRR